MTSAPRARTSPASGPRSPDDPATRSGEKPLRIGVSSCLLGEEVRYDGQHKRDAFLADQLARFVAFVPVCPEVELGLGVPRETIRLERRGPDVRLVAPRSGRDLTEAMRAWAVRRVRAIAREDLDGYVLKKDSPSCGMERVKVWNDAGHAPKEGRGAFAAVLVDALPLLPVEEEGRLRDDGIRENFVERVFAYRRLKDVFGARWTVGRLVAFHSREKLLLLAHDPESYRALGRTVAAAKQRPRGDIADEYGSRFMRALARPASRGRETNVLQHVAGYFKDLASADERAELVEAIADYRAGLVPLVVPLTLLKHHVRRHADAPGVSWLATQTWLSPHPKELMLRNHV
ncbi:MAG TPA: DUF523 and DUF1722 domain-containing protein [Anaeromyxobacteraceae bacterium]|nr:DUF523 and DUF1722 domain-containing protein [Anaeromyxobacteraceae bacterium]